VKHDEFPVTDEELWLYTLCKKNGIIITDIQIRLLQRYKNLLLEWNKKINLVSRKNEDRLWKGHIALSLSMLFKIKFSPSMSILDLGTGGGFPGIPLSIMLPDSSFVLLDSTQKKIIAVKAMADELPLSNLSTVWGRAEEIGALKGYRSSFDAVVARSVSGLSNLIVWGIPFLRNGSTQSYHENGKLVLSTPSLITFKGMEIDEEEEVARRAFPKISIDNIPLVFPGSEEFDNFDKQLVIVTTI
jgi:16S rRNA (guanine527-N7)-methyltransferase